MLYSTAFSGAAKLSRKTPIQANMKKGTDGPSPFCDHRTVLYDDFGRFAVFSGRIAVLKGCNRQTKKMIRERRRLIS